MAHSDFSLEQLKNQFSLELGEHVDIFREVAEYPLDQAFLDTLKSHVALSLAIDTEKARSEFIIAPILGE